jgi:hypothetical protein
MPERDKRQLDVETARSRVLMTTENGTSRQDDLGDDDIVAAIDELIHPTGMFQAVSLSAKDQLAYDRQTEAELKSMFSNIVWEFLEPVGLSLYTLADYVVRSGGEGAGRIILGTVDACIGALRPLIKASETIKYHDILDVLKSIERPLLDVQTGKRKALTERDTKNLTRDFNELRRLIHQSLSADGPTTQATVKQDEEAFSAAATPHISEVPNFFRTVDPGDLQKLYAAGLTRLGDLGTSSALEISQAAGVGTNTAELIKACAFRAMVSLPGTSTDGNPAVAPDTGFALVEGGVEDISDSPDAPLIERGRGFRDSGPLSERDRLMGTLDVMAREIAEYGQSATKLNLELQRAYRALLRLHGQRDRLRGEVDFHRDELRPLFEMGDSPETNAAIALHKQLLQELRQVSEVVLSAQRKMEMIAARMGDAVSDVREVESEIGDLRRKRRARRQPSET